jgi:dienelactone hydrolase
VATVRFFLAVAAVGFVLALGCVVLAAQLQPRGVSVERVSIAGPKGRLAGTLWKPEGKAAMGVLVCHGVMTNKEVMEGLAAEVAERGALALTFDYGGYGESERHDDTLETMVADSAAALSVLRSRLEPDAPVAAVGHSMGATYSVELATRVPAVGAVVALGNEPVAPDVPPRNVLYAFGAYDVFHSLDEVLATARESARDPALQPGQLHGRFVDGSARALEISPLTEHGVEPLDPVLIRRVLQWLNAAFPSAHLDATSPIRAAARAQARLGAFLGFGLGVLALLLALLQSQRVALRIATRLHLAAFGLACGLGTLWPVDVIPIWADGALALLVFGSLAVAVRGTGGSLRNWAGVVLLLSACLLVGVLANGAGGALRIGALRALPLAAAEIASLRPYEGLCMLRALAFHRYTRACVPSPGLCVFLAVEFWRPGWLVGAVASAVRATLTALRVRGPVRLYGSRRSLVLAALVLIALVALLVRRASEGWLDSAAAWRMSAIAARGLLLPLALFALVVNLVQRFRDGRARRNARGETGGLA